MRNNTPNFCLSRRIKKKSRVYNCEVADQLETSKDIKDTNQKVETPYVNSADQKVEKPEEIKTLGNMPETEKEYRGRNTISVPALDEYNDFNTWMLCVEAWAETTELSKEKQGFVLANEIPMSSKRYGSSLREDLFKQVPPNTLTNNEEGVKKILDFMKSRFYINPHKELFNTH